MRLMAANTPTGEPAFRRTSAKQKESTKSSVKDKVLSDLLNILRQYENEHIEATVPRIFFSITDPTRKQYGEETGEFKNAVAKFLEYGTAQADTASWDRRSGDKQDARQDKGINHMDHCLRLDLLRRALKNDDEEKTATAKILCETIVERWPVLAFMRKYKKDIKSNRWLKEQCSHKGQHGFYHHTPIPFHLAVSKADHELVKLMLDRIQDILRQKDVENNLDQLRYLEGAGLELDGLDLLRVVKGYDQKKSICRLALEGSEDSEASEPPEEAKLKTLKALLTVKGITTSNDQGAPDEAFELALRMKFDTAVIAFLDHDVSVSKDCLKSALENLETSKRPSGSTARQSAKASDAELTIVKALVTKAAKATKGILDHEIIRYIIKGNLTSVWNADIRKTLDDTTKTYLLPTAVLYKSLVFVKLFVGEDPKALEVPVKLPADDGVLWGAGASDGDGRFPPLWYNNHRRDDSDKNNIRFVLRKSRSDEVRREIRDFLVDRMIRTLPIDKLSDILHRSHEPFKDLCFDISSFGSDNYSTSDFIDSIFFQEKQGGQQIAHFEKTLKYVAFPQFDVKPASREMYLDNANLRKPHKEVFEVLRWLKFEKSVDKIIELVVPDRLINPHDDVDMACWLKTFGVEKLDWRVLDLSFTTLRGPHEQGTSDESKKKCQDSEIRELHLYSSGKQSVLDHWFSPQGIESLKNLEKLRIHVVRETCTGQQVRRALSSIEHEIAIRNTNATEDKKKSLIITNPDERPWYSTPAVADLTQITQYLSPRLAQMVQNLSRTVDESLRSGDFKRTKVAILDNGILCVPPMLQASQSLSSGVEAGRNENKKTSEKVDAAQNLPPAKEPPLSSNRKQESSADRHGLWSRIKDGKSFVESSSRFNPWQFPSDAHGTQMANLICALDPYCDLYVARVAETTVGINAASVAKAIDWAVDTHNVDVISMSFVVDSDPDKKLKNAVKKATANEVVMLCSTHDEGSRVKTAWPASLLMEAKVDSENLIVLAACDEYGQLLREAEANTFTYKIAGKDVRAGVVPFVKSTETISGSSVATALAAGIASLTITGDRLANPGRKYCATKSDAKASEQIRNPSISVALPSRFAIVKKHLDLMVAEGWDKHVLLEKFGKVGNTGAGKGHLYNDPYLPTVEEFLDEFRPEGQKKSRKSLFRMPDINFTKQIDFQSDGM